MNTVPYSGKKFWYNTKTGDFRDVDGGEFDNGGGEDDDEDEEEEEEESSEDDELPSDMC